MPLLQENTPKRELLSSRDMKVETDDASLTNPLSYPSFSNSSLFTPSQLLMASQLMAATRGLSFPTTPGAFFHPGLLAAWQPNSPPSPPTEQLSPAARKNHNNNNNIEKKAAKSSWKLDEEAPLPSPTSSSSPPSDAKDGGRDRPFTCDVCHRSFGYKHVLQNHERTHTGEKPFECQECHKRFTRDHHLKTHMRLHTGERPYHCEHCDRQFVQVANLRRHLRVHTGERPYTCDRCAAKFSDSNQLKAHLLIHTDEKPFECERCRCRFRRRHHLAHHKCGVREEELTPVSDEPEDEPKRRRVLHPPSVPLVTLPLRGIVPEQTEPEDLSMSTGLLSHSSGESPLSRSPSSRGDPDDDYAHEYKLTPVYF